MSNLHDKMSLITPKDYSKRDWTLSTNARYSLRLRWLLRRLSTTKSAPNARQTVLKIAKAACRSQLIVHTCVEGSQMSSARDVPSWVLLALTWRRGRREWWKASCRPQPSSAVLALGEIQPVEAAARLKNALAVFLRTRSAQLQLSTRTVSAIVKSTKATHTSRSWTLRGFLTRAEEIYFLGYMRC